MNRIIHNFTLSLRKRKNQRTWLEENNLFLGDIHNHCNISYGYGKLEDAIDFARQQLDFFTVTGHFAWPDMESFPDRTIPPEVIDYHKKGFAKLRQNWPAYMQLMKQSERKDFVPFLSYEFHSFYYGDYTIVCKNLNEDLPAEVLQGEDDIRLQELISHNDARKSNLLPIPHHIGYKSGYRGINWDEFNEKSSPLVEICSMHGCAESHEATLEYLHTMGPRSKFNTMQGGLAKGNVFGVTASTDHHNASPGSYGFGRTGLWIGNLDRNSIWDGLIGRKTVAFTGDKIEVALFVDDMPIGSVLEHRGDTHVLDAYVAGLDEIEKVEVIKDNQVIHIARPVVSPSSDNEAFHGFVGISVGWGKKHAPCDWNIQVTIQGGEMLSYSPRLRGKDMVDPLNIPKDIAKPHCFKHENGIHLTCQTEGNTTPTTNSIQGFVLEVQGVSDSVVSVQVEAVWNGEVITREYRYKLQDLQLGPESEYVRGFVSPALFVSQFVPVAKSLVEIHEPITSEGNSFVYLRVFQKNKDVAYTSPIWF